MFASDRDLLALLPELFRDVGWAGQRLVSGTGNISGTTLTLTAQDNTFAAAGVDAGHVAIVDGVSYEVIARLTATTATISRIRPDPAGPVIPPAAATGKPVLIHTFAPQIAQAHRQVLRELGIDPDDAASTVTEASITNPGSFREVEAMGALSLILFNSGATAVAVNPSASDRISASTFWRDRFANELRQVSARIDTDGDGNPDATRHPGAATLVRM